MTTSFYDIQKQHDFRKLKIDDKIREEQLSLYIIIDCYR